MKKTLLPLFVLLFTSALAKAQSPPWQNPLRMAWSSDGKTFDAPTIFQDSSGVPCVIRWKGDTLICAFQWFRLPQNTPSWDRVAVKFSYDAGLNWTTPIPIVVNGLPANYQRPLTLPFVFENHPLSGQGNQTVRKIWVCGNPGRSRRLFWHTVLPHGKKIALSAAFHWLKCV